MKVLKFLAIVCGFLLAQLSFAGSIEPLVLNGKEIRNAQIIGATVGINKGKGFCTGAYIGNGKVVTAAHCTKYAGEVTTVKVVRFTKLSDKRSRYDQFSCVVTNTAPHPDFEDIETTPAVDVAVLTIETTCREETYQAEKEELDLTDWPQYDLATDKTVAEPGRIRQVGYGVINLEQGDGCGMFGCGPMFPSLYQVIPRKAVELDKFDKDSPYDLAYRAGQINCMETYNNSTFYFGDSGGPSFVKKSDRLVLVGIHSTVWTKGDERMPVFACDVTTARHREWILAQ